MPKVFLGPKLFWPHSNCWRQICFRAETFFSTKTFVGANKGFSANNFVSANKFFSAKMFFSANKFVSAKFVLALRKELAQIFFSAKFVFDVQDGTRLRSSNPNTKGGEHQTKTFYRYCGVTKVRAKIYEQNYETNYVDR